MNDPQRHHAPAGWQPTLNSRLPRPRVTSDLIAALTARLTPRDRWLLHALHEHRVLTTTQITQLLFTSQRATNARLHTLHLLRGIDRFRPLTPIGSAPWHYVLDDAGAAVLAAATGLTLAQLGHRRDRALALAHSPRLAHLVGVNTLFTSLVAHARRHPGHRLALWWPEHRCKTIWGDLARPDGYGRWQHHHTSLDFFLEHDTGSEPLHRVAAKLDAYADLAQATGITTPVLINLPTPRREAHLHQLLPHPPVPVATTNTSDHPDPAGPAWLPAGQPAHQPSRLHLDDLSGYYQLDAQPTGTSLVEATPPASSATPVPGNAPIGLAPAWALPTALPDLPPSPVDTPAGGRHR